MRKTRRKAENSAAENSKRQAYKINSVKYGAYFVILLYYQQKYHTVNYKSKILYFKQLSAEKVILWVKGEISRIN